MKNFFYISSLSSVFLTGVSISSISLFLFFSSYSLVNPKKKKKVKHLSCDKDEQQVTTLSTLSATPIAFTTSVLGLGKKK